MSPSEGLQLATSLAGFVTGLPILIRVGAGAEVIGSHPWKGDQWSLCLRVLRQ